MNIALNELPTAFCRENFRQIKTVQEQAECVVPDALEDVGQIVSAQAQIFLKSKDLSEHAARIGAEAEISVLYVTESRDSVRCMVLTKPFEIGFDAPVIEQDAAAQISLCCTGVQARAVNSRKISAQFFVRAELSCFSEDSFTVPFGAADDEKNGLQLRRGVRECLFTVQLGEKSFVVNEQLSLGAECEPASLSCVRARLLYYDHQPIGSKLLIKGGAELTIAYETLQGSCPVFSEQCVPFSVLIDMPDENCTLGRVIFEPTALYAELGDAINGSRVVETELHAVAQYRFERSESIEYLCDAYSSVCPVIAEESSRPVCLGGGSARQAVSASDRIQVGIERGEIVSLFPDVLSYSVREGKAELSASVGMLFRAEDGAYSSQQRLLSFETTLEEPESELIGAHITAVQARRDGEEIALDAAVSLDCIHAETGELRYLSSLSLDTENAWDPASIPSLTIARRGERDLWTLAKLYHSSIGAIEKAANDFPMTDGLLLIPKV